jgi:hypothetical protein
MGNKNLDLPIYAPKREQNSRMAMPEITMRDRSRPEANIF